MQIQLNGQSRHVQARTVKALVEELALTGKRIAVEHNLHIVSRTQWAETTLTEGDRVEIVHAIGGG
jgi:sulfur carrier protein